jgi:hypothetical protein
MGGEMGGLFKVKNVRGSLLLMQKATPFPNIK